MTTYRLYIRKPEKREYIKFIHIKCIDGKFYGAKPGKKYRLEPTYTSWKIVDGFLLPNFNISKSKYTKEKPLTEVQWLDKVCDNFKE